MEDIPLLNTREDTLLLNLGWARVIVPSDILSSCTMEDISLLHTHEDIPLLITREDTLLLNPGWACVLVPSDILS